MPVPVPITRQIVKLYGAAPNYSMNSDTGIPKIRTIEPIQLPRT